MSLISVSNLDSLHMKILSAVDPHPYISAVMVRRPDNVSALRSLAIYVLPIPTRYSGRRSVSIKVIKKISCGREWVWGGWFGIDILQSS